jgi:hypothetical protein
MKGTRSSTRGWALAARLTFWSLLAVQGAQTWGAGLDTTSAAGTMHFELPAQPLVETLQAYGRMTDSAVLVDSNLLERRVSTPVNGDFSPREALQRLLAGTGLQARFTSSEGAIITPLPADAQATAPGSASNSGVSGGATIDLSSIQGVMTGGDYRAYAAMVQTRLTEALCASAETRPGHYRLVLQIDIDKAGTVASSHAVGSTGEPSRDAAIERAARTLALDSAPPAGLREPITILLRPDGDGVLTQCPSPDAQD